MRPPLDVEVSRKGGATVVRPQGELDMATVPALREALAGRHGPVILDTSGIEFIDGCGLHLLVEADARARQDGMDLMLLPGPVVERLLGLTGVRDRFSIRENP